MDGKVPRDSGYREDPEIAVQDGFAKRLVRQEQGNQQERLPRRPAACNRAYADKRGNESEVLKRDEGNRRETFWSCIQRSTEREHPRRIDHRDRVTSILGKLRRNVGRQRL